MAAAPRTPCFAPTDADAIRRSQAEPAAFGAVFDRHFQAEYADAVNGKSPVPGGKLGLTVDGTYKDAFGC